MVPRLIHLFFAAITAAFCCVSPVIAADAPAPAIELPLEIHLIQNMEMTRRGVVMTNWVTATDIEKTVMPEINRIWRQAGIRWTLVNIKGQPLRDSPERHDLQTAVLNFTRASSEDLPQLARPARAVARQNGGNDRSQFHLFVVPYVGRTLQGFAVPSARVSFLGVWTDKPSNGADAPRRVKLTEPEPLFIGSLARTASHELGHLLGLKHDSCTVRCLMGETRSQGYLLTTRQIETVRAKASAFLPQ
jgi:hypothetical protein